MKLSWFQRNILCMKVDIHREQYMVYKCDVALSDSQKQIMHHVSNASGDPPAASHVDSYARFCEGNFTPLVQIGAALDDFQRSSSHAQYDPTSGDDADEEEDEDIPGADGDSEISAGEETEDDNE